MYMGLKMIVAGLYKFSKEGLNDNVANDDTLIENINRTMHNVRAVLCDFYVSIWLTLYYYVLLYLNLSMTQKSNKHNLIDI